MEKYSYTLELYKSKVFNIDTKEDCNALKKASEDAEKIELYFNDVPNKDILRENIILSFWFNKHMDYKDRINYIRGLVYSRRYIDYKDVFSLLDEIEQNIPVRETTIFEEKGFSTFMDQDFFLEAFYEDIRSNFENYVEEQRRNQEDEKNNKGYIVIDSEDDIDMEDEETREEIKNAVEALEEELANGMIDLTPKEKVEQFKDNFERYIDIMLKRKNVTDDVNNRGRNYIIIGMRDWFYYIIGIMEDMIEIDENNKKILSKDLSQFI